MKAAVLRALVAAPLLLLLASAGSPLLQPLLPAARTVMGWAEPAFAVQSLQFLLQSDGERLRAQVAIARPVAVGERLVMPHPRGRAYAQVPAAQAWYAPLLLVLLLIAWPAAAWGEALLRAVLALPALALVMALDLPLVLLAEIWKLLLDAHDPGGWKLLVAWSDLLRSGGRVITGVLAATAVLTVACALERLRFARRRRPSSSTATGLTRQAASKTQPC